MNNADFPPATALLHLDCEPRVRVCVPLSRSEISAMFSAMALAVFPQGTLEFSLVGEAAMESLNAEHMQCHGPTNVLSFPAQAKNWLENDTARTTRPTPSQVLDEDTSFLGWMVLAPVTMQRECLLYGQEPVHHFIHLCAHGFAHLLGFDHSPAMDTMTNTLEQAGFLACPAVQAE